MYMVEIFLVVATILLTSLTTGLFFGYAVSVNWALRRLDDEQYVHTMQIINQVIKNPWFLTAFMAPVLLMPLITFLYGGPAGGMKFWLFTGAAIAYIFGTFGITMAGNVPLNERLDKLPRSSSPGELSAARTWYEQPWNTLHAIRTVLGVVAVVLLSWGALL